MGKIGGTGDVVRKTGSRFSRGVLQVGGILARILELAQPTSKRARRLPSMATIYHFMYLSTYELDQL